MRHPILLIIALGIITFAFAGSSVQIPNLHHPQDNIFTSGQPTRQGFQQIAGLGVKTVINVLPEKECIPDEQKLVTANHMLYYAVPFELTGYNKETITRFANILANAEKPVLIHCSTGNHVGGLWFAYRVMQEGVPMAQGLKEGRNIGMKSELEDSIFLWIISYEWQNS